MRIEKIPVKKPVFEPFYIVVESLDELKCLTYAVGEMTGDDDILAGIESEVSGDLYANLDRELKARR